MKTMRFMVISANLRALAHSKLHQRLRQSLLQSSGPLGAVQSVVDDEQALAFERGEKSLGCRA